MDCEALPQKARLTLFNIQRSVQLKVIDPCEYSGFIVV